jgi:hypothetical protein
MESLGSGQAQGGIDLNLVRIRGAAEAIRDLGSIEELRVETETAQRVGEAWGIMAYATDAALDAVRARGLAIDVLMDNEQLAAHEATVRSQIRDVPGAPAASSAPAKPTGKKQGA